MKYKSNLLVAVSYPHDMPVQSTDKIPSLFFGGYYKKKKNKLIRTQLESHSKQTAAIPST